LSDHLPLPNPSPLASVVGFLDEHELDALLDLAVARFLNP
jgi:hypothetical protein